MRYTSHYISPFGGITLAADGRGITGLWFDGQKYFGDTLDKVSARAVGGAVGHNPISIFCPCHRVVGSNGSLTGYSGGLQKKVALLTLEHVNMEPFFLPKKGTAL